MNDALRQAIFEAAVRQLRDERGLMDPAPPFPFRPLSAFEDTWQTRSPLYFHPLGFEMTWPMPERCQEWMES